MDAQMLCPQLLLKAPMNLLEEANFQLTPASRRNLFNKVIFLLFYYFIISTLF